MFSLLISPLLMIGRKALGRVPALRLRASFAMIALAALFVIVAAFGLNPYDRVAAAAEVDDPASTIHVEVERGLLTVEARDATLADVLRMIGEQAGFRVVIDGDLGRPITWSFSGVPVAEGVRRLLENASWIMSYAASPDESGERIVVEVRVVGSSAHANGPVPNMRSTEAADTTLAASKTPVSKETLLVDLAADHGVRLRAVRNLVRRPDATATDGLALFLSKDKDPVIRRAAAIGLGRVGGERAFSALTTALGDEDGSVRKRAVQGLGKIGGERAARALAETLLKDKNPEIRALTARMLGRTASKEALVTLHAAALDPDAGVRKAVAAALARLEDF